MSASFWPLAKLFPSPSTVCSLLGFGTRGHAWSTVLDGVKISFWACRAAFGDSGLAAVKGFLFLGARDGETAIYCSLLRPELNSKSVLGWTCLSFRRIATALASRPSFLA